LQGPMGEIIPFTDANPFKFLMPAASTFENLAYGNSPLSEYAGVTNRRLPIVKTGRENELTDIADVALMASGLPMASRGVARGANYLGDVLTQATRAAPPAAPMRGLEKAYAEAEQRIAGLVEPQAGVRGFNIVQPGDMVSGLTVRKDVPNMSSIAASLDDYEILSGIREVPRNAFDSEYLGSLSYDKLDKRTKDLADQIRQSKEINPVIVGMDSKGAYIIEGGHRFDALMSQDTKSIPALVVIDKSDPPAASRGVTQGANYLGDVMTQAVTRNPQATSMRALDEIARMSPVPPKGIKRSEIQAEAKSLGLPSSGKTKEIQELINIVKSDPRTWTQEQYTLIRPHLAIHQDFRPGSAERSESIMREGLRSGMVDYLEPMERGQYSFAKGLVGSDAYLFPTRGLKFKSASDPHLAPGNIPLFRIKPEKGQNIYEAIVSTAEKRKADDAMEQFLSGR
jgi:disulfide oxidoreductase YuzD